MLISLLTILFNLGLAYFIITTWSLNVYLWSSFIFQLVPLAYCTYRDRYSNKKRSLTDYMGNSYTADLTQRIMARFAVTDLEAMDVLDIPEEDRDDLRRMILEKSKSNDEVQSCGLNA